MQFMDTISYVGPSSFSGKLKKNILSIENKTTRTMTQKQYRIRLLYAKDVLIEPILVLYSCFQRGFAQQVFHTNY